MSGCVNCVWDVYRDELEEWAGKRREADGRGARARMQAAREREREASVDDDGGGSETNWEGGGGEGGVDELLRGVPVGIREFMRTEKRLKERHRREGTLGG